MSTLYLTIGCSSSGKSTYANQMVAIQDNLVNMSRDDYRYDGYCEVSTTYKLLEDFYKNALDGKDIVISDTHLNQNVRTKWLCTAKRLNMDVVFLIFNTHYQSLSNMTAFELLDLPQHVLTNQAPRFKSFLEEELLPNCKYVFI